jgi:hypothetical protein
VLSAAVATGDVFLTLKDAAAIASCSIKTLRRAFAAGELRCWWAGQDPRVRHGDLIAYLGRNAVVPEAEEIRRRAREAVRKAGPSASPATTRIT